MMSKLEHRKKRTDVDTILQTLSENAADFKQAVDMARDQTIESTERVVQFTAMQTALVHRDVKATGKAVTASIEKSQIDIESKVESENRHTRKEIKADIASLESSIMQTLAGKIMASTRRVIERDRARLQSLLEIEAKNETMEVLLQSRSTTFSYLPLRLHVICIECSDENTTQERRKRTHGFDKRTSDCVTVAQS